MRVFRQTIFEIISVSQSLLAGCIPPLEVQRNEYWMIRVRWGEASGCQTTPARHLRSYPYSTLTRFRYSFKWCIWVRAWYSNIGLTTDSWGAYQRKWGNLQPVTHPGLLLGASAWTAFHSPLIQKHCTLQHFTALGLMASSHCYWMTHGPVKIPGTAFLIYDTLI